MSTAATTSSDKATATPVAIAALAATLLIGASAASAQSPSYSDGRGTEPRPIPPIELVQVPRDACVWGNAIYSSGAMRTERDLFTTYFECERGTWTVVSPSDAIFRRRAATAGTARP